jgi:hypothetical protein
MILRINYMNIKKNNISFSLGKKERDLVARVFFFFLNMFFKRGNVSNKIKSAIFSIIFKKTKAIFGFQRF